MSNIFKRSRFLRSKHSFNIQKMTEKNKKKQNYMEIFSNIAFIDSNYFRLE